MIYHYINVIDDYIGVNEDCYTLKKEPLKRLCHKIWTSLYRRSPSPGSLLKCFKMNFRFREVIKKSGVA